MTYLWNHPGQPRPVGSQGVLPDYAAAALAPMLVMAGLLRRQRTGKGLSIDMAQMELVAYLLGVSHLDATCNGYEPGPVGNDFPAAGPHGCYPCVGDDRWCVIAVETEEQWHRLCQEIGRPDLADDPRYRDLAARRARRGELDALLATWTGSRDAREVMLQLQGAGVPAGVVQSGQDLFEDPHLRARDFISAIEHPTLVPSRLPACRCGSPAFAGWSPAGRRRSGPPTKRCSAACWATAGPNWRNGRPRA
jgi:benzylsuccinate CoA-transferase BbsF subunit